MLDADALLAAVRAAEPIWQPSIWKWHWRTSFVVLRGGPAPRDAREALVSGAGLDRPVLSGMPAIRDCLDTAFPAPAALAWLGLSPPGARILLHVDNTAHWDRHHRVHVPLLTSPEARICVSGRTVHMPAGSVWMFNNSRPHGALHDGPADRIHLIVDLPDTPAVRDWLATGERIEGDADRAVVEALSSDPMTRAAEDADAALLARFEAQ